MNKDKSPLLQRPDYLVCICMGVMYSEIVEAIEQGRRSLDELSDLLMLGTGCTSCVAQVEEILAEELKK